jgi:hypothetical protein
VSGQILGDVHEIRRVAKINESARLPSFTAKIVERMESVVDGPAFVLTGVVAELVQSRTQSLLGFLDQYRVGGGIELEKRCLIEFSPLHRGLRAYVGVHESPLFVGSFY